MTMLVYRSVSWADTKTVVLVAISSELTVVNLWCSTCVSSTWMKSGVSLIWPQTSGKTVSCGSKLDDSWSPCWSALRSTEKLVEHPPSSKSLPNRLVFLVYHTFDAHFWDVVTYTLNVNKYSTWIVTQNMIEIDAVHVHLSVYCICKICMRLRVSVLSVWCFNHFPSFFMQHAFSIWLSYFLLLQGMTYIAGAAAKFQCFGGIAAFNSIEPKLSHISALIMFLRISNNNIQNNKPIKNR